jgi:SAM-dependent methyltransferase
VDDPGPEPEVARIRDVYSHRAAADPRYAWSNPAHRYTLLHLERDLLDALHRHGGAALASLRILEVGCGSGYWLRQLVQWGASPERIVGIDLLPAPGIENHFVLIREGFAAFVERTPGGFGGVGGGGLLTEDGFAPLVWRGGRAYFVRKGFERPASDREVEDLRQFSSDLKEALRQPEA